MEKIFQQIIITVLLIIFLSKATSGKLENFLEIWI